MKKFTKLIAIALCGILSFSTLSACKPKGQVIDGIDPNKTQIYVGLYNGGLGTQWFDKLQKEWNANNDTYEIWPIPDKLEANQIVNTVNLGSSSETDPSIYFSVSGSGLKDLVEKNKLEDLSEWANTTRPDGADGKTIAEKISDMNAWKQIASNSKTGGLYMLPWNESVAGFIYDHDTALDPNEDGSTKDCWLWKAPVSEKAAVEAAGITCEVQGSDLIFVSSTNETNYRVGSPILRAGRDGKYGTYDDGQPETMAEWEIMISKIVDVSNYRAFMWTGQFETEYVEFLNTVFFAQYSGIQSVVDFFDKDSNGVQYEMYDGTKSAFTIDDGYKSNSMMGVKKTVEFISKYLTPTKYLHPTATESSYDHGMTQGLFVMGYRGAVANPKTAMILEGSWWENEARLYFASNAEGNPERGYGKRDYRYMLTPSFDGGLGAFGDGTGTAMAISENSSIIVPKCSDPDKLAAIKDFLSFTLKEENLRRYTLETGVVRPYEYEMTADDRAQMTPFAKNNWDIYNDSENIGLVRRNIYATQPINYATTGCNLYPIRANGIAFGSFMSALARNDANSIVEGISNAYNQSSWTQILNQAKAVGFYAN